MAKLVACWDEPHWLSTVVAATEIGRPAVSHAVRADVEGLLAHLGHAAADDLADLGRVDAGAVDQLLEGDAEQVGGVHGGEAAAATPDGRADGFDR